MNRVLPAPAPVITGGTLATLLFTLVIIAALYFGQEVLVPVALAILLSFVLTPIVRILQGWRVPRGIAVAFAVLLAFGTILGLGTVMVSQVNELASNLPSYRYTLREKIHALRGATAGSATLERAAEVLHDLGTELKAPQADKPGAAGTSEQPARPIPVEIRHPDPGPLQTVVALVTPLIPPLATTGIVFLFVIFILLQREDLRNRLVRLAGVRDLQRTTAALDDAGDRLGRLFLAQLALNAAFGAVIGAGLFIIGVPSAPLWGILAMILRFVPYVGAAMAAVFPIMLAAAVGPDWSMVLWTALLFVIVEPLTGHVIEPFVVGRSSGLSPLAVVVSAVFWTWLWGPVGLVLATPLTICLAVVGRHVDRLKFLDVMFGDEPVLSPAELVYQRMLADDPIEAAEQAELYLKQETVASFYEDVLVESLNLAHRDADWGELDEERQQRVRSTTEEIIEDIKEYQEPPASTDDEPGESAGPAALKDAVEPQDGVAPSLPDAPLAGGNVLCIPGHGPLDDMLAQIVAQLAERNGVRARAETANALSMSRIFSLETEGVTLACICYLGGGKAAQIRYAVKRLRQKLPDTAILICLPGRQEDAATANADLDLPAGVTVKRSLSTALEEILEKARRVSLPAENGKK